jgi:hypothetical protein
MPASSTRIRGVLVPASLLAVGIAAAGWFIGDGLFEARATDRYVTVRGLSERDVAADLVIWPIVFTVTSDDLSSLQRQVNANTATVREFLAEVGLDAAEVGVSAPRVTDREAQGYASPDRTLDRYVAETTLTVRTGRIDVARRAMEQSGELVGRGVAVIRSYELQTQYLFTGLESVKPEMIAEATRDARQAAEQFAQDSGARVGSIRNAQQGYFSIDDRDPFSPEFKKVRVVTTVQFFLVDD